MAILTIVHGPADGELAEQVDYDTQEQLAFCRLDLSDVGDPLEPFECLTNEFLGRIFIDKRC